MKAPLPEVVSDSAEITCRLKCVLTLSSNVAFTSTSLHIRIFNTAHKGIAEDHRPLCILKRGAWWAARLCSSILLILPSPERSVSVGDCGTMEVISLISVLLLWLVVLLMFISEKSHGLCLAASASLCHFLSAGLSLQTALTSPCCIVAVRHTENLK